MARLIIYTCQSHRQNCGETHKIDTDVFNSNLQPVLMEFINQISFLCVSIFREDLSLRCDLANQNLTTASVFMRENSNEEFLYAFFIQIDCLEFVLKIFNGENQSILVSDF